MGESLVIRYGIKIINLLIVMVVLRTDKIKIAKKSIIKLILKSDLLVFYKCYLLFINQMYLFNLFKKTSLLRRDFLF